MKSMYSQEQVLTDYKEILNKIKIVEGKRFKEATQYWDKLDCFYGIYPSYLFSNENLHDYYKLIDLIDKNVLTICGSGDQVICALLNGAKNVDTIDSNNFTYYTLFLKIAALQSLSYKDFISFYKIDKKNMTRKNLYCNLRDAINRSDVKLFWDDFFKENEELFPYCFRSMETNFNLNSKRITYLNTDKYEKAQKVVKDENVTFNNMSLYELRNSCNLKYDFINCSNVVDYLNNPKLVLSFLRHIIRNNLNNKGTILLDYAWTDLSQNQSHYLHKLNPLFIPVESYLKTEKQLQKSLDSETSTAIIYRKKR